MNFFLFITSGFQQDKKKSNIIFGFRIGKKDLIYKNLSNLNWNQKSFDVLEFVKATFLITINCLLNFNGLYCTLRKNLLVVSCLKFLTNVLLYVFSICRDFIHGLNLFYLYYRMTPFLTIWGRFGTKKTKLKVWISGELLGFQISQDIWGWVHRLNINSQPKSRTRKKRNQKFVIFLF